MNEKISDTSVDELSYEQAFAELEEIVLSLEAEEHSLEKAISLYERGQNLAKHCADLLELAEQKVQQLSGEELTDFDRES